MCLTWQKTKDPRKGSPLSSWIGGATEKDWPKRLSDCQLQEAQKTTDRAITPAVEAVRVPAYLVSPESTQAKQLCHLHVQSSLGQNCPRQKESCVCPCRVTLVVSKSLQPCRLWLARLLCHRGSLVKNTGVYCLQLPYPSTALHFLLP